LAYELARPVDLASLWLARAVARMPATAAAWGDGRISTDHVRRLVRACSDERLVKFLEAEAHLITEAVRFAGDHHVVTLSLPGRILTTLRLPGSRQLDADLFPGATLSVTIPTAAIRVLGPSAD
jgi:hypothetical protein